MGGSTTSTTQQQSQTAPWSQAQPLLGGILGQLSGNLGNTGMNSAESNAINSITGNGASVGQFAPSINGVTANLLAGGGALNQAPALQQAYNALNAQTSPLASNTNYDPMSTPGLATALQGLNNSISTGINGQFAAAGRDMSPANSQALAYGLAQGEAPLITQQYNANVANQQNAANSLYGAGNTTANSLAGLQQNYLNNQLGGVGNVTNGLNAINAGNSSILAAQQGGQQLPLQNLGLLANIGVPIAGLGSQSSGTSNTQTSLPWWAPLQAVSGLFSGNK